VDFGPPAPDTNPHRYKYRLGRFSVVIGPNEKTTESTLAIVNIHGEGSSFFRFRFFVNFVVPFRHS
jgi:hypothetical protein